MFLKIGAQMFPEIGAKAFPKLHLFISIDLHSFREGEAVHKPVCGLGCKCFGKRVQCGLENASQNAFVDSGAHAFESASNEGQRTRCKTRWATLVEMRAQKPSMKIGERVSNVFVHFRSRAFANAFNEAWSSCCKTRLSSLVQRRSNAPSMRLGESERFRGALHVGTCSGCLGCPPQGGASKALFN